MKVGFKNWRSLHRQQHFPLLLSSLLLLLFFSSVSLRPCFAQEIELLSVVQQTDALEAGSSSNAVESAAGSFVENGEVAVRRWWWWKNGRVEEMTAAHECVEHYGVMPCSTSLGGNLALLVIYGYMLLNAAQFLSHGSELLLAVLSPGVIGGLVLPILGAFPDALLILVSGLGASQAEAQSEVLVGMGLVAGSSVMVLTALWGSCLIFGRCDLEPDNSGKRVAKDRTLTKGFSFSDTGVTTDPQTKWLSWIMMATLLPYVVAQAPQLLGLTTEGSLAVAIAGVISVAGLIAYCTYQLVAPWIQERRISWAKHRYRMHILHKLHSFMNSKDYGPLFGGGPANLERVFNHFDTDNDHMLTREELKGLIVGLGIESQRKMPSEHEITLWMKEFDVDKKDGMITKPEFDKGMRTWMTSVSRTNGSGTPQEFISSGIAPLNPFDPEAQVDRSLLATLQEDGDDEDGDEESKALPTTAQIITRAVLYLIAGAAVAGIFSDPLVDAIGGFSKASGIPPFFIAFIATPLATNSSEAISSILFARGKRTRNISMTYSQIYGAVTMNNTLCLSIFLAIVYFRGLLWDFSAEITVILFSTLVMGGVAAARTTFPLWMAFIGIALYPISIGLVAFLDYVCGWH